ncbi:hypothetical protein PACTADRAFT_15236 [Pachysolen tannophilus NRRL Y-2460]|uniref:Guanine nucleotide-binding protein alpha-2 subunit n=1 Tax=Pachysolen tannophilus NRRL Y-2460 TaxID=669874 RepID=A0A1E4TY77_PACTA|nr:hypothetical protein PACTADRAFT_15236 [Pachysolen tannophilus NRRL Y-2460]
MGCGTSKEEIPSNQTVKPQVTKRTPSTSANRSGQQQYQQQQHQQHQQHHDLIDQNKYPDVHSTDMSGSTNSNEAIAEINNNQTAETSANHSIVGKQNLANGLTKDSNIGGSSDLAAAAEGEIKILLLGSGESGKSTILKQMKILHQNGFSQQELRDHRPFVYKNILDCAVTLAKALKEFDMVEQLEELKDEDLEYIIGSNVPLLPSECIDQQLAEKILKLVKDPVIDELIQKHGNSFYLMDSANYFFENLERIFDPEYIPSSTDVLRTRKQTSGIFDTVFDMGNLKIHMYDVGGQRSERKKWIHCFYNVTLIIFCVALSEYDQVLLEESTQNRLEESFRLFDSVVNSRWFSRTSVVLFLNKIDIFAEKLASSPLENYFPDYTGGNDVNKAAKYILWRLTQLNRGRLNIYPHVTQAIDTSNIKLVFAAVKETILENSLLITNVGYNNDRKGRKVSIGSIKVALFSKSEILFTFKDFNYDDNNHVHVNISSITFGLSLSIFNNITKLRNIRKPENLLSVILQLSNSSIISATNTKIINNETSLCYSVKNFKILFKNSEGNFKSKEFMLSLTAFKIEDLQTACNIIYFPFANHTNYIKVEEIFQLLTKKEKQFKNLSSCLSQTLITINSPLIQLSSKNIEALSKKQANNSSSVSSLKNDDNNSDKLKNILTYLGLLKLKLFVLDTQLEINTKEDVKFKFRLNEMLLDITNSDSLNIILSSFLRFKLLEGYLMLPDEKSIKCFSLNKSHSTFSVSDLNQVNHEIYVDNCSIQLNDYVILKNIRKVMELISLAKQKTAKTTNGNMHIDNKIFILNKIPEYFETFDINITNFKIISCFKNIFPPLEGIDGIDLSSVNRGIEFKLSSFRAKYNKTSKRLLKFLFENASLLLINESKKPFISIDLFKGYLDDSQKILETKLYQLDGFISLEVVWNLLFIFKLMETAIPRPKYDNTKIVYNGNDAIDSNPDNNLKWLFLLDSATIKLFLPNNYRLLLELDKLMLSNVKDSGLNNFRIFVVHPFVEGAWVRLITVKSTKIINKPKDTDDEFTPLYLIDTDGLRLTIPFEFMFYKIVDNLVSFIKATKQIRSNFSNLSEALVKNANIDWKINKIFPHKIIHPLAMPKLKINSKCFIFEMDDDPFEAELSLIFQTGQLEQKERILKLENFMEKEEKMLEDLNSKYPSLDAKYKKSYDDYVGFSDEIARNPARKNFDDDNFRRGPIRGVKTSPTFNVSRSRSRSSSPLSHDIIPPNRSSTGFPFQHIHHHQPSSLNIVGDYKDETAEEQEIRSYNEDLTKLRFKLLVARKRLYRNFSESWINRYNAFKASRVNSVISKNEVFFGETDEIPKRVLDKYDIVERPNNPALFSVIFKDLNVILDKPHTFELENYHDFLYEIGKKQPKNLSYSTLIPLNLHLNCSRILLQLRDYPLALLHLPNDDTNSSKSIDINGDIIIGELFYAPEELRLVYVPFVKKIKLPVDSVFSLNVPRTLTSIKFYTNLRITVSSSNSSQIAWCKSFQPGISYAMSRFDVLTKPPIDRSPKIGFWDKFRLNFHGKFDFNFKKDLVLFIKGSSSPYNLIEKGAGFAFCWDNEVNLRINHYDSPDKFMVITSKRFKIAIPNFSSVQKQNWKAYRDRIYNLKEDDGNMGNTNIDYLKVLMKLRDEKIVWKLGMLFERDANNDRYATPGRSARTSSFKPHYEVALRNPVYVKDGEYYDSYKGFRSDYVHMAVSVDSSGPSSYNSVHLSPMSFAHFFPWWSLFGNSISVPAKTGKLFENKLLDSRRSIKFGAHLFSMKYQLKLKHLFIGHLYSHSSSEELKKHNKLAFTGLKAQFSNFSMDLHQRKQQTRYVNTELNVCKSIWKMKMNQGELDFENADIRLISALFNDNSIESYLAENLGIDTSASSSENVSTAAASSNFQNMSSCPTMESGSWIDFDDYVELESPPIKSRFPKVKLLELVSSPRFSYFKQADADNAHDDNPLPYPFGDEPSHECLIGENHPERTQEVLLENRAKIIEDQITTNEVSIHALASDPTMAQEPLAEGKAKQLENEIHILKHKLHIVRRVLTDISISGKADEQSIYEEDTAESEIFRSRSNFSMDSRSYSIAPSMSNSNMPVIKTLTSRASFREMKEASSPNAISTFNNRFVIHNMKLKWNNSIRNILFQYIQKVSDRRSLVFFMGRKAVNFAENLISQTLSKGNDEKLQFDEFKYEFESPSDTISNFDHDLRFLQSENEETVDHYLFKLVAPQIQLVSDEAPDSCLLITCRDVTMKVISVSSNRESEAFITESEEVSRLLETRHGVLLNNAQFYVLDKEKIANNSYGIFSTDSEQWPPWLAVEVCYDPLSLENALVIERTTLGFIYTKPNSLYMSNEIAKSGKKDEVLNFKTLHRFSQIKVFFPKIAISSTSHQYDVIYNIATDLLIYSDIEKKNVTDRLENLVAVSDIRDYEGFDKKIEDIQKKIILLRKTKLLLKLYENDLTKEEKENVLSIDIEIRRLSLELTLIMKVLQKTASFRKTDLLDTIQWILAADQIIWHFLDDNRNQFVDFAIAESYFTRVQSPVGANSNKIVISRIQGFDLQPRSRYPDILVPFIDGNKTKKKFNESYPMIEIEWTLLKPVGGIKVIDHAELKIQPLKIQIDHSTATKIFNFLYPSDGNNKHEDMNDSPVEILFDSDSEPDQVENSSYQIYDHSSESSRKSSIDEVVRPAGIVSSIPSHQSKNTHRAKHLSAIFSKRSSNASLRREVLTSSIKKNDANRSDNEKEMMQRASKYSCINRISIPSILLCVSFKGTGYLSIVDVEELIVNLPDLNYVNKLWTSEEFALKLKKDILKSILRNTGQILGNKFKSHKKKNRFSDPMKQITNYKSFLSIEDLKLNGRESGNDQQTGNQDNSDENNQKNHESHIHHHHHNHAHGHQHVVDPELAEPTRSIRNNYNFKKAVGPPSEKEAPQVEPYFADLQAEADNGFHSISNPPADVLSSIKESNESMSSS